ncbi:MULTISPECIES: DUF427 domain-containing protein [Halomonadaceae]|nr:MULTISPECIES: DUF427 domain-containing protein [Halomonas]MDI4638694.1 DUF427 domain-containing protein [Halomonas sp. BMC7]
MSKLSVSSTVTHCPFKGGINYYSLVDVAWFHEQAACEK